MQTNLRQHILEKTHIKLPYKFRRDKFLFLGFGLKKRVQPKFELFYYTC